MQSDGIGQVQLAFTDNEGGDAQAAQLVNTFVNENRLPGKYSVFWDGKNYRGEEVPSGAYLYRLRSGDSRKPRRWFWLSREFKQ